MLWIAILVIPYFFLLLRCYRHLVKIRPSPLSENPSLFVSVIVPCRNEEANITSLLDCLRSQNYPSHLFEVVVVDDNSGDNTFEAASHFRGITNLAVCRNNGKGKKQAIRTGINVSGGNLVITTDADCSVGDGWLRAIAGFYDRHRPDMIICPVRLIPSKGFRGRFQELEFLGLQGITAGYALAGDPVMCNGAGVAFTREAYLHACDELHFEIASGDDMFLLHSLKRDPSRKIMWIESADAVVSSLPVTATWSFLMQRRRWISKAGSYTDKPTIILGIITFVTILVQLFTTIGFVAAPASLSVVFAAVFILKSIPDLLILSNTAKRYGRRGLTGWFIPSQIIYPFYVIAVTLLALLSGLRKDTNSPSLKGI